MGVIFGFSQTGLVCVFCLWVPTSIKRWYPWELPTGLGFSSGRRRIQIAVVRSRTRPTNHLAKLITWMVKIVCCAMTLHDEVTELFFDLWLCQVGLMGSLSPVSKNWYTRNTPYTYQTCEPSRNVAHDTVDLHHQQIFLGSEPQTNFHPTFDKIG